MTRRKRIGLAAAIVVWLLVVAVWVLRRPADLGVAARDAMLAAEASDGHRLMKYAFPLEIEVNDLTPKKLERLFKEVINPYYESYRRTGAVETENFGHQGAASMRLSKPGRPDVTLGANTYRVEGRPRAPITSHLLAAWSQTTVDRLPGRDMRQFTVARNNAVIAGLHRDRKKLEDIGIVAIVAIDPIGGTQTVIKLDELESQYTAWNAQLLSQHPVAPQ